MTNTQEVKQITINMKSGVYDLAVESINTRTHIYGTEVEEVCCNLRWLLKRMKNTTNAPTENIG